MTKKNYSEFEQHVNNSVTYCTATYANGLNTTNVTSLVRVEGNRFVLELWGEDSPKIFTLLDQRFFGADPE